MRPVSPEQRLQQQRVELIYVISEQTARRIRHYSSSFMKLGGNRVGKSGCPPAVPSFHVDSDHLQTRWYTLTGNMHRFKLTIRIGPQHGVLRRATTGTRTFEMGVNSGHLQPGGAL